MVVSGGIEVPETCQAGWLGLQSWALAATETVSHAKLRTPGAKLQSIPLFSHSLLFGGVEPIIRGADYPSKHTCSQTAAAAGHPYNLLMFRAVVITVSDSCFAGRRVDLSGPAVAELLQSAGFEVAGRFVVPDEQAAIEGALRHHCEQAELVVTTGGTGVAPRDVTPEATRAVCDRLLDGFPELMRSEGRKHARFAPLSRAISGCRGSSLIVNLPGSPRGAQTSLEAVLDLVPHALKLLEGSAVHHDHDHGATPERPEEHGRGSR